MPILKSGYEYDIFISYRQKDNRSDQWVTHFVHALKEELDATFKVPVSVYFDENPHDGLHETHDVDDSLRDKVKCLVFIPIISRTYCDPKCFAWEKEFLPFLEFATNDPFGMKVRLLNGNVTSRVLPVRIHDLDNEDEELFKKATGGMMRSVEFIHKGTGVNRPLRMADNEARYLDNINKMGIAIKDIVQALKTPANIKPTEQPSVSENTPDKKTKRPYAAFGLVGVILLLLFWGFWYIKPVNEETTIEQVQEVTAQNDQPEIRIGVLPFTNLSDDESQEYYSEGISEEILNILGNVDGLHVPSRTSAFVFKNPDRNIVEIARELNVLYLLEGSVRKDEETDSVRITAQLIDAHNDRHLWSETYDRARINIFKIQEEIANAIAGEVFRKLGMDFDDHIEVKPLTNNMEAYELFLQARHEGQYLSNAFIEQQIMLLEKAVALDPGFAEAWETLASRRYQRYNWEPDTLIKVSVLNRAQEEAMNAIELKKNSPLAYNALSRIYASYDEHEKSFEYANIANQQGDKHALVGHLARMGYLKKAFQITDSTDIYYGVALLSIGKTEESGKYIQQIIEQGYINQTRAYRDYLLLSTKVDELRNSLIMTLPEQYFRVTPFLLDAIVAAPEHKTEKITLLNTMLKEMKIEKDSIFPDYKFWELAQIKEYKLLRKILNYSDGFQYWVMVLPGFSEFRQSDYFKDYCIQSGLVNYWKKNGWPDLCRPLPDGGFECW